MLGRFSLVQLFATLWTAAHQAPLSVGFSRQKYRGRAQTDSYSRQCSLIHSFDTHLWVDRWMTGGQSTGQGGRDKTSTRDVRLPSSHLAVPPPQAHPTAIPREGK